MSVGVMKDYKLKLRKSRLAYTGLAKIPFSHISLCGHTVTFPGTGQVHSLGCNVFARELGRLGPSPASVLYMGGGSARK